MACNECAKREGLCDHHIEELRLIARSRELSYWTSIHTAERANRALQNEQRRIARAKRIQREQADEQRS